MVSVVGGGGAGARRRRWDQTTKWLLLRWWCFFYDGGFGRAGAAVVGRVEVFARGCLVLTCSLLRSCRSLKQLC